VSVNQAPVVTNPGVQNNVEGAVVSLQVTATDPDGDALTYSAVGLPSGLSINANTGLISGTIANGASTNSLYAVAVTVTDNGTPVESTMVSYTWNIMEFIENQAPVAVISVNETSGIAPLTVSFDGSNSFDDIEIVGYLWDFKDGNTSEEINPVHIFEKPGTYRVELTVSDGFLKDTEVITITVKDKKEEEKMKVIIAPNPARELARVYLLNAPTEVVKFIYIHDSTGRYINTIVAPQLVNDHYAVPIAMLHDGVYYITMVMESGKSLPVRLLVKN
ncbi:PKD domain-containing protein, partial [Arenibacter certesii]|uniref:PKD domain-containing protein n=2 Tax=Arenibacter certesii TaxID=228955 RepID=UPI0016780434